VRQRRPRTAKEFIMGKTKDKKSRHTIQRIGRRKRLLPSRARPPPPPTHHNGPAAMQHFWYNDKSKPSAPATSSLGPGTAPATTVATGHLDADPASGYRYSAVGPSSSLSVVVSP
jgi:hypothetical protein